MARERIATAPSGRANRFSARPVESLTGARTLTRSDIERYNAIAFNCGSAARDVNLPAKAGARGVYLFIANATAATHALTVKDGATTVVAVPAATSAFVWCDWFAWYGIVGAGVTP